MDMLACILGDKQDVKRDIIATEEQLEDVHNKRKIECKFLSASMLTPYPHVRKMSEAIMRMNYLDKLKEDRNKRLHELNTDYYELKRCEKNMVKLMTDAEYLLQHPWLEYIEEDTTETHEGDWMEGILSTLKEDIRGLEKDLDTQKSYYKDLNFYLEVSTYRPYPNVFRMWKSVMRRNVTQRRITLKNDILGILDYVHYHMKSLQKTQWQFDEEFYHFKKRRSQDRHGQTVDMDQHNVDAEAEMSVDIGLKEDVATEAYDASEDAGEPPCKKQCTEDSRDRV